MDYEALKEQWSEVEDRDGVRLSWNVFPSTRMVGGPSKLCMRLMFTDEFSPVGSVPPRCAHRCPLYSAQGKARHTAAPLRTCDLQAAMPFCPEPVLVKCFVRRSGESH